MLLQVFKRPELRIAYLPFSFKDLVEDHGSLPMHRRGDVAVEVKRHADVGVAEHLTDDLRVNPPAQKDRRRGVPQVVKADTRQACAS